MRLLLKVKEVCPVTDCEYEKECDGKKVNRPVEFNCSINENQIQLPLPPVVKIKGKTLLQG